MRRTRFGIRTLLVCTFVFGAAFAAYRNSEHYKRWESIEAKIEQFDIGKGTFEMSQWYRDLFAIAGADLLPWSKGHKNDSVAVQSAWEMVELSVPLDGSSAGTFTPSSKAISDFLELIEQRCDVQLPTWWRETVVGAVANRRYNIYGGEPTRAPYHFSGMEGFLCPVDAQLKQLDDGTYYVSAEGRLKVPDDFFDHQYERLSAHFEAGHVYVAPHEGFGFPHDVVCFDRTTNQVLWKSTACGCWWAGVSGFGVSYVSFVVSGGIGFRLW